MDTWEYALLTLDSSGGEAAAVWTVAGSGTGERVPPQDWYARLASAGAAAWELVAATSTATGETLYFKRRSSGE